ncbi:MAG: hypothetical protein EPO32_14515 [Anaerolineae bacterium]|nr:MAG: hypothetical protein EPO32_14515 [Anaerolineae bacterium]
MPPKPTGKPTDPKPMSPRTRPAAFWWLGGALASTYLLATASVPGFVPTTAGGVLDIALVVVLVALTVWLQSQTTAHISQAELWRAYGVAAMLPALLLVGIWQYSDRFNLETLIPGIAWRLWLMLYTLPHLLAALRVPQPPSN